ncbi:MAG: hypothetical protein KKA05_11955, partial [Alphaproteobacteria bacterium]|nr:hypothetical protein [Alphaproteobacteria bacterium]
MKSADVEDGSKSGITSRHKAELREARKRIRLPRQENEVLRRAAAYRPRRTCRENDVPARPRAGRQGRPDPGARHG